MLVEIGVRAEGDDLGAFARAHRQPRARRDAQLRRIGIGGDIGGGDDRRVEIGLAIPQQMIGGQQAREPRELHRGFGSLRSRQGKRGERPLHRLRKIERGIGNRDRAGAVERAGHRDQHRRIGARGLFLVGELERDRACGGDQQLAARAQGRAAGFDRTQREPAVLALDDDVPAPGQRIERPGRSTRVHRACPPETGAIRTGTR